MRAKPEFKPMFKPPRRCEIDGKPAVFHRWVDEDKPMLIINALIQWEEAMIRLHEFKDCNLIHPGDELQTFRHTFALVEYDDGTVGKVEPEKVKFTDRRAGE